MTEPNSATHTDIQSSKSIAMNEVFKPSEVLASPKPSSLLSAAKIQSSPPDSLRSMLTSGSPLKSARSAYPVDFDRLKKRVEAKLASSDQPSVFDMYGYGYGYGADEDPSPKQQEQPDGTKRRRYERRNSKTPAMLMAMKSPLLCHLDFLEDKKEFEPSPTVTAANVSSPVRLNNSTPSTVTLSPRLDSRALPHFDVWDGGLDIAEDLVMQLQKRKRSSKPS